MDTTYFSRRTLFASVSYLSDGTLKVRPYHHPSKYWLKGTELAVNDGSNFSQLRVLIASD